MAEYQQREGGGVLFKNDRKKNEKEPDYRGNALVNGVEMDVAAWVKESQRGKFFSLSIKPKGDFKPKGQDPRTIKEDDSGLPF